MPPPLLGTPQILHVVCRFTGIHFWGQNKYWSILTGELVVGSFIMGQNAPMSILTSEM